MCGIAGVYDVSGTTSADRLYATVNAMSDAVRHRGPDHSGRWIDERAGIAMGQERLAIRDLSPLGHQPMTSSCGRYVITYNGEVYSQREIVQELGTRAGMLKGSSDTEVILEACAAWGVERALQRLIGMFAFALFDKQERTLTLARDRLGIKPLYWTRSGSTVLFGSELKALAASGLARLRIDRDALAGYMQYSYVAAPRTIYEGVRQMSPGTMLAIDAQGDERIAQYWSLPEIAARPRIDVGGGRERDALERLDALLVDSVSRRLVSDVPVGSLLSGGVDSSLVTALMAETSHSTVQTFTVGFDDVRFDESAHARAVAQHLGTEHHELTARPEDAMSLVEQIPKHYDEPFADSSQIPTMLVAELTRRRVAVVLSGDGGDELFYGYSRYAVTERTWLQAQRIPGALRRPAGALLAHTPVGLLDRLGDLLPDRYRRQDFGDKVRLVGRGLAEQDLGGQYRGLLTHGPSSSNLVIGGRPLGRPGISIPLTASRRQVRDAMRLEDMRYYLPDDILTKVDRASMRVALEVRVPLLDHRVVELAWALPSDVFTRDGQGKWPLRDCLYRRVPRSLVDRPKVGFAVPIAEWLRGPLRSWAQELLDPALLARQGLLDPRHVALAWAEHQRGLDRSPRLWDLLVLQMWLAANPSTL